MPHSDVNPYLNVWDCPPRAPTVGEYFNAVSSHGKSSLVQRDSIHHPYGQRTDALGRTISVPLERTTHYYPEVYAVDRSVRVAYIGHLPDPCWHWPLMGTPVPTTLEEAQAVITSLRRDARYADAPSRVLKVTRIEELVYSDDGT